MFSAQSSERYFPKHLARTLTSPLKGLQEGLLRLGGELMQGREQAHSLQRSVSSGEI